MSQSDYIKYKSISSLLRVDSSLNKLPPVLNCQNYTDFLQFSVENQIQNKKPINSRLTASNEQMIFDIEKRVQNCPSFLTCANTNLRPNRKPLSTVYFTPTPQPLTINQINSRLKNKSKEQSNQRTACKCVLNSKNTGLNICKCKTSHFGIVR
jgi:hypothetical protein